MSSASTSTCSQPSICRPRISKRRHVWVLDHGQLGVGRIDGAGSKPPWLLALTAMCPCTRKASPPNMRCSLRPGSPWTTFPDPVGKLLVVCHVGQEDIGASSTTASCRLTFAW